MAVEAPKPEAQPKSEEVARISAEQNELEQRQMGVPPGLASLAPGAKWLIENGGLITGHIEEESGDIVIDKHKPR